MKYSAVLTTINSPTKQVLEMMKHFENIIVIGDNKTPNESWADPVRCFYFSISHQKSMDYKSIDCTPENHYSRKNIGYLIAMHGSDLLYEFDDDNAPLPSFEIRRRDCITKQFSGKGWINVYAGFTDRLIWPRGLPLNKILSDKLSSDAVLVDSPIHQGLANGNPDVDAIWRLTRGSSTSFSEKISICNTRGVWCPFNSQSTWWWPEAYGLMYLPIHATFRMTDIWRSFVAQRCLWELGKGVVFHSPAEVFQDRNPHDLMKDFESEIPGYLHNEAIATMLGKLRLKKGQKNVLTNLRACYEGMVSGGFLPQLELRSVDAWIEDVKEIQENK